MLPIFASIEFLSKFTIPLLLLILILQINFQWIFFTQSKSLIFSDPFEVFKKVSIIVENGNYTYNKYYYPPAYYIFCSVALLISPEYTSIYYFLKFGGFFLLTLYLVVIFFLSLKIFKRIYISLFCSILSLTYFLFMLRITFFPASSLSVFIILISLFLFIEHEKLFFINGFLLIILYYIHPITAFFYYILLIAYFFLQILSFNRRNAKNSLKQLFKTIFIMALLITPFIIYLLINNRNPFNLFKVYSSIFESYTINPQIKINYNNIFLNFLKYIDYFKLYIFKGDFLENYNIITYWTIGNFLILSLFGLLYKVSSKELEIKKISLVCKISLIIIFILYTISSLINIESSFFRTYLARSFEAYFPFIIILTGLGIGLVEKIFRKSFNFIKQHYKQFFIQVKRKNKFLNKIKSTIRSRQSNRIYSIKKIKSSKDLTIFIIIFAVIFGYSYSSLFNFDKQRLLQYNFQYFYEDDTIEMYFYIKEKISKGSIVLMPNFSNQHFEINYMLYDYNIIISSSTYFVNYNKFFSFIIEKSIDYLLLNKSELSKNLLSNILNSMTLEFVNKKYYLINTSVYYRAYDFEEDIVGANGTNISWITGTGDSSAISIVASEDGHEKVMKMINSNWANHFNSFPSTTAGIIELWWKKSNTDGQSFIFQLTENGMQRFTIFTVGNGVWFDGAGSYTDTGFDYVVDAWYHMKAEWTADDECSLWIDGVLIIDAEPMLAQVSGGINRHGITTSNKDMNVYFDAIWIQQYF